MAIPNTGEFQTQLFVSNISLGLSIAVQRISSTDWWLQIMIAGLEKFSLCGFTIFFLRLPIT